MKHHPQSNGELLQKAIKEIQSLRQAGKHQESLQCAEQALEQLPWHWQLACNYAAALRLTGNLKKAYDTIEATIMQNANIQWLYIEKANILAAMNNYTAAFECLDLAPSDIKEELTTHRDHLKCQKAIKEIQSLRQAGKHQESLQCAEQALEQLPWHWQLACNYAAALRLTGNLKKAYDTIEATIMQNANIQWLYIEKANILAAMNNYTAAFECLDLAPSDIKEELTKHRDHLKRQQIILQSRQLREAELPEKALAYIQQALNDYPPHPSLISEHAICLHALMRWDEALQVLQAGIVQFPDSHWLLIEKARIYLAQEYYEQAKKTLDNSVIPSNLPNKQILLARIEFQEGNREVAIKRAKQHKHHEHSTLLYAELLRRSGKAKLALLHIRSTLESYPKWAFRIEEARCLTALNLDDQLNKWLEKWRESDDLPKAYYQIALQQARKQFNHQHVIALAEVALERFPASLDFYQHYLHSAIQLKDSERAIDAITILSEKYADRAQSHRILATTWSQMGDHEQALYHHEKAVKLEPNNIEGCCQYVDKLNLIGKSKIALSFLDKRPNSIQTHPSVLMAYAKVYWHQGHYMEAQQYIQKACTNDQLPPGIVQTAIHYLTQLGYTSEAQQILEKLDSGAPDYVLNHALAMATIQEAQGNLLSAINALDKQQLQYPQHEGLLNRLVKLRLSRSDTEGAEYDYKQLLDLKVQQRKTQAEKHTPTMHGQMINEFKLLQNDITITDNIRLLGQQLDAATDNSLLAMTIIRRMFELQHLRAQITPDSQTNANFEHDETVRRIPLKIFQYWDQPEPPEQITHLMDCCRDVNPDYEYTRFNNITALQYLKKQALFQAARAFQVARSPATKADILRLALLWCEGGIYLDADDLCVQPFSKHLHFASEIILYIESGYYSLGNNFMASQAKSTVIEAALQQATENVLSAGSESTWFSTGPALITRCFVSQCVTEDLCLKPNAVLLQTPELRQFLAHHQQVLYKQTNDWWVNAFQDKKWHIHDQFARKDSTTTN
ncbi:MAG: glycosyltransferase [bacterium]